MANKTYRIRIGGELLARLDKTANEQGLSSSEIIARAIAAAKKGKWAVVADKKRNNDHKKGDYGRVIKVYRIVQEQYQADDVREWLSRYLQQRENRRNIDMEAARLEDIIGREAKLVGVDKEAFLEPFADRVEYWRQRRKGLQSDPGGLGMREAQEQTPKP